MIFEAVSVVAPLVVGFVLGRLLPDRKPGARWSFDRACATLSITRVHTTPISQDPDLYIKGAIRQLGDDVVVQTLPTASMHVEMHELAHALLGHVTTHRGQIRADRKEAEADIVALTALAVLGYEREVENYELSCTAVDDPSFVQVPMYMLPVAIRAGMDLARAGVSSESN